MIRPLLRELMLSEQPHYDHPQLTADEIERDVQRPPDPNFTGENVIFAARVDGNLAGFCWCVLFNPGTGLEAEVAEVYVDDRFRGKGIGGMLLRRAVELFRARNVTFAAVWTRETNPGAVRLYEEAGFRRTEQLVLTWLPLPGR
ncbi:MAG TPA: GNAT family N-acetyltransferase [Candidatus Dormibacteraeota bacterium]